MTRLGYLGPRGTFHEQAALLDPVLTDLDLVPFPLILDVIAACQVGEVELVAIENSIEGTVTVSLDAFALKTSLLVQREVVLDIQLDLMATPGTRLADVERVISFPHATAHVRGFLSSVLPEASIGSASSTSEAARLVAAGAGEGVAAVAPPRAADLHDLVVLAPDIGDHPDNKTRFFVAAARGVPEPTGHDKTTIVCFQHADQSGSLLAILQEFAVRGINLTKLESRPTKRVLGEYCFIIDFKGHVAHEVVGDCLRELKIRLADVKLLGSYPSADATGEQARREAQSEWRAADEWLACARSGQAVRR